MRRGFRYNDAVKLLGGDTALLNLVDRLSATGLLLVGGINLLGARAELVRLGNELTKTVADKVTGLNRVGRTQLLEAAHSVIVVTAFFEALGKVGLPVDVKKLKQLKIIKQEQLAIIAAERPATPKAKDLVSALLGSEIPLPGPELPAERLGAELTTYFAASVENFIEFLQGLLVWERLSAVKRDHYRAEVAKEIPDRALELYQGHYRRLAVDCPEFGVWVSMIEHSATRTSLDGLRDLLLTVTSGMTPDDRRDAVVRAHCAALDRPLVEAGDLPRGLAVPTLRDAYVAPLFRVAEANQRDEVSKDSWWTNLPVRSDAQDYLAGYLTCSRAITTPLMVLGQPGSGKSVLTKMLAALLPPEDFFAIRVVLRDVPAEADLQEQIEHAIRVATGERLDWPELARSAGAAVPVVLLDGFDELLQATGVSRSDYLTKIRDFQRREREHNRAVVVIVTSRIAVANRARLPDGTVVLRLEPFEEPQVARWLSAWNGVNADYQKRNGLDSLSVNSVLAHGALAGQPLLLFMLALYDADGNALQRDGLTMGRARLYEELLTRFARREIAKSNPSMLDKEIDRGVDQELARLSVVAFAMFNRGSQWVAENDLGRDLDALFDARNGPGETMRTRLTAAQLIVGRFFFIHEARASLDNEFVHTYEFLHATFGEYLVARLVHRMALDLVVKQRAVSAHHFGIPEVDDTMLHALLSFAPLTTRAAIFGFLGELLDDVSAADRTTLTSVVRSLLASAQYSRIDASLDRYQPRRLPTARRIAVYTANLVILALTTGKSFSASDLSDDDDPVTSWQKLTLLWRSQLGAEEWTSLIDILAIRRTGHGTRRDVVLMRDEPPSVLDTDLAWSFGIPDSQSNGKIVLPAGSVMESGIHVHQSPQDDVLLHAVEPLSRNVDSALNAFAFYDGKLRSPANVILSAITAKSDVKLSAFEDCLTLGRLGGIPMPSRLWTTLLHAICADPDTPTDTLTVVLGVGFARSVAAETLVHCAMRILMSDRDNEAAYGALDKLMHDAEIDPRLVTSTLVQLIELGLERVARRRIRRFVNVVAYFNTAPLLEMATKDPGLIRRARSAMSLIGFVDLVEWPDLPSIVN
ncbi:hypothetical protein Amsp01_044060 [Amycolatopsis sp. NBRC 101858]|uniref:NACHT domain-containing protein n=1 Tax=Amycolatopsis sp. NBRC 101858 TaxID=3032200 RepID=UPI0024A35FF1|nr:AAA family ATPase [Amycolatopsis sp. NBRC 101858]GLY38382.1 hypothetical protein Amsp01_044060 [Amycolatopsis sp. NBRC 101858]